MPTLTVGTNSYINVADADTYVSERLGSTDWDAATTDEKEQALIMATKAADRSTLQGVKKTTSQTLQFPRCYSRLWYETVIDIDTLPEIYESWVCETATPQDVLDAVVEEAMQLIVDFASGTDANTRRQLQADGVKSFTLSKLSETYSGRAVNTFRSRVAQELMSKYTAKSLVAR